VKADLNIDLGRCCDSDVAGRETEYVATGVVLRHGASASKGHYTAAVRCGEQGKWYEADDANISMKLFGDIDPSGVFLGVLCAERYSAHQVVYRHNHKVKEKSSKTNHPHKNGISFEA
jgi:hypothetical protein